MRLGRVAGIFFAGAFSLFASAQDRKVELRCRFEKGEKFPLKILYSLSVKLDKVPEAYQGILSEDPINLKCEGTLQVEVKEVDASRATLEGRWRTLKAKGAVLVNDIDFSYDSEKKGEEKAKKKDEGDDGLGGFFNIEERLRRMSTQTLKLAVDKLGALSVEGRQGKGLGELEAMFLSLNGLMGALPVDKVGRGDAWKGESKVSMPVIGGKMDIKVASQNTYASDERLGDRSCAVIKSKFAVNKDDQLAAEIKIKTSGDGEGSTYFCVNEGRPAKSQSNLKVRLSVSGPAPGGGDDLDIKATLKIDQSYEFPQ